MDRVYYHYEMWEDYQNRMYDEVKDGRDERVSRAVEILGDKQSCISAMRKVVSMWKYATEQNLTNESCNRRAWLGQACCNIVAGVKEDETRQAWGELTEQQRQMANHCADIVIQEWEKEYAKTLPFYQISLFD